MKNLSNKSRTWELVLTLLMVVVLLSSVPSVVGQTKDGGYSACTEHSCWAGSTGGSDVLCRDAHATCTKCGGTFCQVN